MSTPPFPSAPSTLDATQTLTRAYELLEDDPLGQHLGPLRQPLADLLGHHLAANRHGPILPPETLPDPVLDEVFGRPSSSTCSSCGGTGVRYAGTGPEGHQWTDVECCCQHDHCRCGACGAYPCDEVQALLAVATAALDSCLAAPGTATDTARRPR
ncbi:hypothetical protein [Streptomyces filamentosus]|uniref:hypothetical protein n=1 Tax=Streptomyces filamentosus TaxID=67294 RepID=UPI0033E014D2